jgi:hypothetical protein
LFCIHQLQWILLICISWYPHQVILILLWIRRWESFWIYQRVFGWFISHWWTLILTDRFLLTFCLCLMTKFLFSISLSLILQTVFGNVLLVQTHHLLNNDKHFLLSFLVFTLSWYVKHFRSIGELEQMKYTCSYLIDTSTSFCFTILKNIILGQ